MPFPRLIPRLTEALDALGYTEPLPAQERFLAKIKSGADLFCIAPRGSGSTTTLVLATIQRLKKETDISIPRAMIFAKDKAACQELEAAFEPYIKGSGLDIFCAYDQHDIVGQKDNIYIGLDIIIGTPSRLCALFLQNGVNTSELQLMVIEDADFLRPTNGHSDIMRIAESSKKCQYIAFGTEMHSKMERMREQFMDRASVIRVKANDQGAD